MNQDRVDSAAVPLWLLLLLAGFTALHFASGLALWIVCAFFIFALVEPWLTQLEARGLPPVIAASILIGGVVIVLASTTLLLYWYSPEISSALKIYRKTLIHLYEAANAWLLRAFHAFVPTAAEAPTASAGVTNASQATPVTIVDSSPLGASMGTSLVSGLTGALSLLGYALLCPLLAFFMVAERKLFGEGLRKFYNDPAQTGQIWKHVTSLTQAFFVGNLLLAAVCFPAYALIFFCFNVKNFIFLAALSSIFNLVPFLGAGLSAILPVLDVAAGNFHVAAVLGILGSCLVIHFSVANLITPKVLGSRLDLNATCSTIALIAWGELWGPLGLLLAIPLTAVVKILFQYSSRPTLHRLAGLMSNDPQSSLTSLRLRKGTGPAVAT